MKKYLIQQSKYIQIQGYFMMVLQWKILNFFANISRLIITSQFVVDRL